jgi:tetratricopeptide (TPR) repeat protein
MYYRKTLQIDPKYTNAFINLGLLFFNQKQYDSAILNYHNVLAFDSLNVNAYSYLIISLFLKNDLDSTVYFLKKILKYKIADSSTFKIGRILSDHFQQNKLFEKEIEVAQLLYDYDSVHNVAGVTSEQFRSLVDNLAFAYLFNRQPDVSKYYYAKEDAIIYFYYNMACLESLDKKNKEALENLELSFQNGFKDYDHIQQDTDLDNIRNMGEFKQLLKKYFPDKVK